MRRARLSDGTTLDVDVVVASLGSIRNTEWLEGAGLASGRWGVACDAGCRVFDINGVVTDSICAVPVASGSWGDPRPASLDLSCFTFRGWRDGVTHARGFR